jgi:hypothetical protein
VVPPWNIFSALKISCPKNFLDFSLSAEIQSN